MKKIWKKIGCLFCAAIMSVTCFAACADDAVSAYELAVKNGFVGTEKEWLQSLQGQDGADAVSPNINEIYEAAQANGYKGSFMEFLKEYLDVDINEDNNTTQIAENVMSVVSVICGYSKTEKTSTGIFGSLTTTTKRYASAGSGVFIDMNKAAGNAYVVTNYHVVYDEECNTKNKISDAIYLYPYGSLCNFSIEKSMDVGGDGIKATFVGGAMDYDIAVLKIEGSDIIKNNPSIRAAEIGASENVTVGEKVYVIGSPGGDGISVTSGLVSVESEYIMMYSTDGSKRQVIHRVMRTDAAVNPGNSGGGLFNSRGELIGITNAKSVEDDVDNICYAIPVTQASRLWQNILDNNQGSLLLATLGITTSTIESKATIVNGKLQIQEKFIVDETSISSNAAAYNKLAYGDVIVGISVNGKAYPLMREFQIEDALLAVRLGDTVVVKVIRDGKEKDVAIKFDKKQYFREFK